jgi:hypothetical protein
VILRVGGIVVPRGVLSNHLVQMGLPADADGSGHLVLPNLAPGIYGLFFAGLAMEGSIAAGVQKGFLATVPLAPMDTAEELLTVPPVHP